MNPRDHEVDKILNDYITTHNKEFDVYFINCEFYLEFDNNFKIHIESFYCHNVDNITEIKTYLLYRIDYYKFQGYCFGNINKMIIKSIFDECNITYKHYFNEPMNMVERRLNFVINRDPQLINALDRNKNRPLIRKYSHVPLNNY